MDQDKVLKLTGYFSSMTGFCVFFFLNIKIMVIIIIFLKTQFTKTKKQKKTEIRQAYSKMIKIESKNMT